MSSRCVEWWMISTHVVQTTASCTQVALFQTTATSCTRNRQPITVALLSNATAGVSHLKSTTSHQTCSVPALTAPLTALSLRAGPPAQASCAFFKLASLLSQLLRRLALDSVRKRPGLSGLEEWHYHRLCFEPASVIKWKASGRPFSYELVGRKVGRR